MEQAFEKSLERVNAFVERLLVFPVAATALILIVNVFTRYVLRFSLTWSAELARYCMVWAAFPAIAVLANRNQHLAVDLLQKSLRGVSKRILQAAALVGSAVLFAVQTAYGLSFVLQARGQVAPSIQALPMSVVYAVIPISGAYMLAGAAVNLLRVFARGSRP
jgi:TRAP-type C4-dicarboxylate transport system permease small subunit